MAGGLPAVMARGVPAHAAIPAGAVACAEVAAAEVVRRVQPTEASERRRADVIDYARRIVGTSLGCEVRSLLRPPLSLPSARARGRAASISAKRSRSLFFFFSSPFCSCHASGFACLIH